MVDESAVLLNDPRTKARCWIVWVESAGGSAGGKKRDTNLEKTDPTNFRAFLIFMRIFCHEAFTVNRISSRTTLTGSLGSSSLPTRPVEAACDAAAASTSHLALLTEAAAAKRAAPPGKNIAIKESKDRLFIRGRISTAAALAAAQSPASADVNGRIEPALAP